MLIEITVFNYFYSFDKNFPVEVYIFRKAAPAVLQNVYTFTVDIFIVRRKYDILIF